MMKLKTQILMTACVAFAGASMLSSEALAAPKQPTPHYNLYGAGSTLVEQYWNVTANCYGAAVPLLIEHSISPPADASSVTEQSFNYVGTGSTSQNCATQQINLSDTINYIGTGSGVGVQGVYSHDAHSYGPVNTSGSTYTYWPSVQYGLSDFGIAQSDNTIYNEGGTEGSGSSAACVQPYGTPASSTCSSNSALYGYGNPLQLYGPQVVFPFSVDPVAIAYNPVYMKVYNPSNSTVTSYYFNINSHFARTGGGLHLSPTTYCKIFTGQITNWNDPAIKADNANTSLRDPSDPYSTAKNWSVPLQIVGRSDSSGTTSIFYRHLAAVCSGLISGSNPYAAAGGKTLPTTLLDSGETTSAPGYSGGANYPAPGVETAGFFTTANGSSGVAAYLAFSSITPTGTNGNKDSSGKPNENAITLGRVGYIGPDFVLPYVTAVGSTTTQAYGLNSADLENSNHQWEAPTVAGALAAFSVLSPPTNAPDSDNNNTPFVAEPWQWVQPISNTSPLASPTTSGAYPMVGTTNFYGYQCYATAGTTKAVKGFLEYIESKPINVNKTGILGSAGLGSLPAKWRSAIMANFVTNSSGNGLTINLAGTAGNCAVSGVIGG